MLVTLFTVTTKPDAELLLVPAKFSTAVSVAVSSATNPLPLKLFGIATCETGPVEPPPVIASTIHLRLAPLPDVVPRVTISQTAYPVPALLT